MKRGGGGGELGLNRKESNRKMNRKKKSSAGSDSLSTHISKFQRTFLPCLVLRRRLRGSEYLMLIGAKRGQNGG